MIFHMVIHTDNIPCIQMFLAGIKGNEARGKRQSTSRALLFSKEPSMREHTSVRTARSPNSHPVLDYTFLLADMTTSKRELKLETYGEMWPSSAKV